MRVLVFFVSLFFLLLGGGYDLYANTTHHSASGVPSHTHSKSHHVKFKTADQDSSIIENSEIDLEEESLHGDDVKDASDNYKFLSGKYSLLNKWYVTLYKQFISNEYEEPLKALQQSYTQSSPIYITQRVLRI
ncbi:hypothetical protein [Pedobacter antarcticus]|uniref:hypothetical protein n=1 Tax=Pedobacter antarcticus TaxID=34086 RepID=UPI001C5A2E8D|nr:hypothetical protein [Pedobacter antarcticus]